MSDRDVTISTLGAFVHGIRYNRPNVVELAANLRRVTSRSNNTTLTIAEHHDATWAASKLEEAAELMSEAANLLEAIAKEATDV